MQVNTGGKVNPGCPTLFVIYPANFLGVELQHRKVIQSLGRV